MEAAIGRMRTTGLEGDAKVQAGTVNSFRARDRLASASISQRRWRSVLQRIDPKTNGLSSDTKFSKFLGHKNLLCQMHNIH